MIVGISTWNPPESLAWQKGFRLGSGLAWSLLGFLLAVGSLPLLVSVLGVLLVVSVGIFMVGCTLAAAAVTSCMVERDRWIVPHLAVRTYFECTRWTCRVTQPVRRTPRCLG